MDWLVEKQYLSVSQAEISVSLAIADCTRGDMNGCSGVLKVNRQINRVGYSIVSEKGWLGE